MMHGRRIYESSLKALGQIPRTLKLWREGGQGISWKLETLNRVANDICNVIDFQGILALKNCGI